MKYIFSQIILKTIKICIVLILTLFTSICFPKSTEPCEKKLKKDLKKYWKYDSKKKIYFSDLDFLKSFDSLYKDCLLGKDTTYLKKLFGKTFNYGTTGPISAMDFYFEPCAKGSTCFLRFIFDQNTLKVNSTRLWIDDNIRRQ
jgi:hypothetical protein